MRTRSAYVNWNAGVCRVLTYPGQELICQSVDFARATRKARKLGYRVRVYAGDGSYVLRAITG